MIGIYKILNKQDGKCYFGSSNNVEKRWKTHKSHLRKNIHNNAFLQRAWNKYGEDSFDFILVKECLKENLKQEELQFLSKPNTYNICKTPTGGDNLSRNPNKEEIVSRIKTTIKNTFDQMSSSEKKKKFGKIGKENGNWKNGSSKKLCPKCLNPCSFNAKTCIKCAERNGFSNPFFGKKHTKEMREKLSEKNKGKYFGNQHKPLSICGRIYKSLGEASKDTGIAIATIRWRILSNNKRFEEYQYV